jgi:predicted acylesterase/phospholipase RssA
MGGIMGRNVKVGVVLSGGGAYGAFQAGVLDALLEAGIKPTHFAGTSIGALNSVLASEHSVQHLRKFWLDMPKALKSELEFAKEQWQSTIEAFLEQKNSGIIDGVLAGSATGVAAGSSLFYGLCFLLGVAGGPFAAAIAGIASGVGATAGLVSGCIVGEVSARRGLTRLLQEKQDKDPLIKAASINFIKRSIARPKMKACVYTTVSNHGDISADDLIKMNETRNVEIGSKGHYELIDRHNRVEATIASMAIPFLIGRKNDHNPTRYFDGGLIDNIPLHGLLGEQKSGEIDCMVVVDVSGNSTHLRQTRAEELRHGPVVYINLQRKQGWERLLDFEKSKSLYRKGYSAGREAIVSILTCEPQVIIDEWSESDALLPTNFIIKRAA